MGRFFLKCSAGERVGLGRNEDDGASWSEERSAWRRSDRSLSTNSIRVRIFSLGKIWRKTWRVAF